MSNYKYRIEILTQDHGIVGPHDSPLTEYVQAAELILTTHGGPRSHVVVQSTEAPFNLRSPYEVLRQYFLADVVALVSADAEGETTIFVGDADPSDMFGAAAATATLKRSWGWDESSRIAVTVQPGDYTFLINPVFEKGSWWVVGV